jgi:hypothetical protein
MDKTIIRQLAAAIRIMATSPGGRAPVLRSPNSPGGRDEAGSSTAAWATCGLRRLGTSALHCASLQVFSSGGRAYSTAVLAGLFLISPWIAGAQEEGNLQANRVISRSENNKLNLNFPKRVTCEYRENPLGIDSAQPRLSWEIQSKAEGRNLKPERGIRQVAYSYTFGTY